MVYRTDGISAHIEFPYLWKFYELGIISQLTDSWFEFCARRMAKERGVDISDISAMQELLDEAWDTCPPAPEIDFRMSFDRTLKYRI